MKQVLRYLAAPLLGAMLLGSCARQEASPALPAALNLSQDASAPGFPEGFETGTKTAYTSGSVTLGSGAWTLNDALLGNTSADAKTGSPGNTVYPGWSEFASHALLHLNASRWLANQVMG